MFKKSKNKATEDKQNKKNKEPKKPLKVLFKSYWDAAGAEMTDFKKNDAKSFFKWILAYFLIALFSLILLIQVKIEI